MEINPLPERGTGRCPACGSREILCPTALNLRVDQALRFQCGACGSHGPAGFFDQVYPLHLPDRKVVLQPIWEEDIASVEFEDNSLYIYDSDLSIKVQPEFVLHPESADPLPIRPGGPYTVGHLTCTVCGNKDAKAGWWTEVPAGDEELVVCQCENCRTHLWVALPPDAWRNFDA